MATTRIIPMHINKGKTIAQFSLYFVTISRQTNHNRHTLDNSINKRSRILMNHHHGTGPFLFTLNLFLRFRIACHRQ